MTKKNPRIIPCPRCRKSTVYAPSNKHRPFCSAQCKNADVIAWADEGYRLKGPPADPEEVERALRENRED